MHDFADVQKLLNPLQNSHCFKDILKQARLLETEIAIPFLGMRKSVVDMCLSFF